MTSGNFGLFWAIKCNIQYIVEMVSISSDRIDNSVAQTKIIAALKKRERTKQMIKTHPCGELLRPMDHSCSLGPPGGLWEVIYNDFNYAIVIGITHKYVDIHHKNW